MRKTQRDDDNVDYFAVQPQDDNAEGGEERGLHEDEEENLYNGEDMFRSQPKVIVESESKDKEDGVSNKNIEDENNQEDQQMKDYSNNIIEDEVDYGGEE